MEPRKKLIIATIFICLYPLTPLLVGMTYFFEMTTPTDSLNETAMNQTTAFAGTLYNILGYLTIASYILLIAGILLVCSVIRSMPKTKVDNPKPEVSVLKPKTNVKPLKTKQERGSIWESLNREIGSPRPTPVQKPVREPGTIQCQDCKHMFYYRSGMKNCPFCHRSF